MTPQQMRELADGLDEEAQEWDGEGVVGPKFTNGAAALRAAADQLEAVRAWAHEHSGHFPEISELDTILTADTAPQEDRDD